MRQFTLGDRVRISPAAPNGAGQTGVIVGIRERIEGALKRQECSVDVGTQIQNILSVHLEHAGHTVRLLRGEIIERWHDLTDEEIDDCGYDRDKLIQMLQTHYGYAPSRAEKEVDLMLAEFQDRLLRAA